MTNFLNRLIKFLGFKLSRLSKVDDQQLHVYIGGNYMNDGLIRSVKRRVKAATVIDVGAAQGSWSISAKDMWPEASFVLFEPLEERRNELEDLVSKNLNFYFIPSAAGKEKSEIKFYVSEDLDGSGVAEDNTENLNFRTVKVTSIDDEIKRLKLKPPFVVKLDTHGFEVPIIEGCEMILEQVSLFIIECYGFQIAKGSLLFWEMCAYMDGLGFRLVDIVDTMRRQKDEAFWQCDAFFIPKDNEIFLNNKYM